MTRRVIAAFCGVLLLTPLVLNYLAVDRGLFRLPWWDDPLSPDEVAVLREGLAAYNPPLVPGSRYCLVADTVDAGNARSEIGLLLGERLKSIRSRPPASEPHVDELADLNFNEIFRDYRRARISKEDIRGLTLFNEGDTLRLASLSAYVTGCDSVIRVSTPIVMDDVGIVALRHSGGNGELFDACYKLVVISRRDSLTRGGVFKRGWWAGGFGTTIRCRPVY